MGNITLAYLVVLTALIGLGNASVPSLNVSIRTDHHDDFEAGSPRVLACIVFGCVPSSPIVTWYLGDTMLRPNVYKEVKRGNFTVSSLTFVPSLSDNGKELVCKVTNDFMTETFEDRVTVSVGHRPTCVNSGFQTVGAVEGGSATIVCKVTSDPEPEQFVWTFADGRTIYTTSKQKVSGHDTQYSTTLVWVARADDFGPLYCRASNRFGEQKQPCTFSVIKSGHPTKCNLSLEDQESLKVRCEKNWDEPEEYRNVTTYIKKSNKNYEHGEDMPSIEVYESQAVISVMAVLAVSVAAVFIFACLVLTKTLSFSNHDEDVIPDIVRSMSSMDQPGHEHIQMQEMPRQYSRGAFLEHQQFHV